MIFFMLTNILNQSTEVIYKGKNAKEAIEAAFSVTAEDGSAIIPNIVSRKKQFIPPMLLALGEL
jgi:manganese-dependent inorganic pyrophosphatase